MKKIKAIIMGAAGRDFHNFNVYFQNNPRYKIVAFTAFQIPDIAGRKYKNIDIYPEEELQTLIRQKGAEEVFFSYSDVSYPELMQKAAAVAAAGARFSILGAEQTMLKSRKPVIAVTAVRTGCGKSAVSQKIAQYFIDKGFRPGIARHPMPYGDLKKQVCQRFGCLEDLEKHNCTIEEREEYEPYLEKNLSLCAGVDYGKILKVLEKESDLIIWDGGNNDTPFYKPSLYLAIADALRPFHEAGYYPGEINFRKADAIIITKIDRESEKNLEAILRNASRLNPRAPIIKMESIKFIDKPELVKGKKVLVVEDGPSMTHGGLPYGAGFEAARECGAREIVDPRKWAEGSLRGVFEQFGHMDKILPATGYSKEQMKELEQTINRTECESVVLATPCRLDRFLNINKPVVHVKYEFREIGGNIFHKILERFAESEL